MEIVPERRAEREMMSPPTPHPIKVIKSWNSIDDNGKLQSERAGGREGKGCGGANLAFFCGAIDDFYSLDTTTPLAIPDSKSEATKLETKPRRCGLWALTDLAALLFPTHFRIYAFTFPRPPAMRLSCLGAGMSFGP